MSKIEWNAIIGTAVFLLIIGCGVRSCDKLAKNESQTYYDKETKRETEYMGDCLKSLPKHECIYRWQSAIRASGK